MARYRVTRVWEVEAESVSDALDKATKGTHLRAVATKMPSVAPDAAALVAAGKGHTDHNGTFHHGSRTSCRWCFPVD